MAEKSSAIILNTLYISGRKPSHFLPYLSQLDGIKPELQAMACLLYINAQFHFIRCLIIFSAM